MKNLKEALFSRKNIKSDAPKVDDNMYNYFLTLYNNGGINSHLIVYCEEEYRERDTYIIFPVDDEKYCKKAINNFCKFKFPTELNDALKDSISQHFAAISINKLSNGIVTTSSCAFFSERFKGFNDFFKRIEILDYEFLKLDFSKENIVEEFKNKIVIPYLES